MMAMAKATWQCGVHRIARGTFVDPHLRRRFSSCSGEVSMLCQFTGQAGFERQLPEKLCAVN
jgi:hypothetical protein